MSLKILRLDYKSLRNSEFTMLVNQVVSIPEKYNPADLHLTKSLGKVTVFLPDLAQIKAQELSNKISKVLQLPGCQRLWHRVGYPDIVILY